MSRSMGLPFNCVDKSRIEFSRVISSSCRVIFLFAAARDARSVGRCGLRAVASTFHPTEEYCLANSNPIPRLAPVTRTVGIGSPENEGVGDLMRVEDNRHAALRRQSCEQAVRNLRTKCA